MRTTSLDCVKGITIKDYIKAVLIKDMVIFIKVMTTVDTITTGYISVWAVITFQ